MDDQEFNIVVSSSDPADLDAFYNKNQFDIIPERALMLAILEDALHCLKKNKQRQQSTAWIFNKYDKDWLFSFGSICAQLEINEDYFKKGIVAWLKKHPLKK